MEFTEDGAPILPLNTSELNIDDPDNFALQRATLTIVNTGVDPGVSDQLAYTGTPDDRFDFDIREGGTVLVITATGPLRFVTTHDMFEDVLRLVSFTTDDQAPDVVRNLTLVVEEHPLGESPSNPAVIPVTVIPVNDRPELVASLRTEDTLEDYLPDNPGFNTSFLLSEESVRDVDRNSSLANDTIGLAIIEADNSGIGSWQYRRGDGAWVDFPAVSDCEPLLVRPEDRVRFFPAPSFDKLDGTVSFQYRAWDGTSEVMCENGTLDITEGMYIYIYP